LNTEARTGIYFYNKWPAFKKEGIVLKFKAKALKKTEETIIHFDMKQTIAAQDGKNILKTAEPATLHIFD